MSDNRTGTAPATDAEAPAATGCCGSAATTPAVGVLDRPTDAAAPCCGTTAEAHAAGSCCGSTAKAEAVATGTCGCS